MASSAAQAEQMQMVDPAKIVTLAASRVEDRYAQALYELAAARGAVASMQAELTTLQSALQGSPDLTRLLQNPLMTSAAQAAVLQQVAAKIGASKLLQDFLQLVVRKRRQNMLALMIKAFMATARRAAGEVVAEVQSAAPLSHAQQQQLADLLSRKHNSRVTLNVSVNENLVGGLAVKIGSRLYDSTIASQLQRLQQTIGAV